VTENDVRRIVNQIGPVPEEPIETPIESSPPPAQRAKLKDSANSIWLMICGVVLPVITIAFELFTRLCTGVFFDPLPTYLHIALVALVPLANLLTWWFLRDNRRSVPRPLWLANAAACGVSLVYSAVFLPMSIFAVIGIFYFGIGLLPLAPLFSFASAMRLRSLLKRPATIARRINPARLGMVDARTDPRAAAACVAGRADTALDRPGGIGFAGGFKASGSISPRMGKRHGDLERSLWPRESAMARTFQRAPAEPELARKVYYRVTGQPFNSVPPPLSKFQAAGRAAFAEFDWDPALGGDSVAGQVKGLSLVQSRLDGACRADEGWAYVEWILEFQNDHESSRREARAQVQLPPGGVVSRLTLWVNGEEREAAFAGRAQVREAYQKSCRGAAARSRAGDHFWTGPSPGAMFPDPSAGRHDESAPGYHGSAVH
jgi:hypothetical protein